MGHDRQSTKRRSRGAGWLGQRTAVLLGGALAVALVGCGSDELADRTGRIELIGRTAELEIDSCGIDTDGPVVADDGVDASQRAAGTVFAVGRSQSGDVVQVVLELAEDSEEGAVLAATGVSFDFDGSSFGAFGPAAWRAREGKGVAPGEITSARVRGSRIQVSGEVQRLQGEGDEVSSVVPNPMKFSFDARCDAQS